MKEKRKRSSLANSVALMYVTEIVIWRALKVSILSTTIVPRALGVVSDSYKSETMSCRLNTRFILLNRQDFINGKNGDLIYICGIKHHDIRTPILSAALDGTTEIARCVRRSAATRV